MADAGAYTTWMPHPGSKNDLNEASTPHESSAGGAVVANAVYEAKVITIAPARSPTWRRVPWPGALNLGGDDADAAFGEGGQQVGAGVAVGDEDVDLVGGADPGERALTQL